MQKTTIKLLAALSFFIVSCKQTDVKLLESGVTTELAQLREQQVRNINYNISFQIPDSLNQSILGHLFLEFDYTAIDKSPLIIDFRNPKDYIKTIKIDNRNVGYNFKNDHIIIKNSSLKQGRNQIEIEFIAGDRALNRNEDYLYTLFVPDRACTAFPCFDQPSLKAIFKPEITTPKGWTVIANSEFLEQITLEKNENFKFAETETISTYLFAFTAGKFQSITKKYPDRNITLYHREDDTLKLNRNLDKIFELQYNSLKWLEDYTQINYPFKKLDIILIPSFQYSGMEHPGAILYRDSRLLLDQSATIRDELNRANLIAHETAHMWFGDLVTMKWFSEVWLKEVFANFIADQIVNPQYPEINHDLNFLISHFPPAYSIDRTNGANPIGQKLENMKNAGTLYGSIIYHKSPIVMKHLENITGAGALREGLQEYLSLFQYSNASWDDLIQILDKKTDNNLLEWSQSWVNESGMPTFYTEKAIDDKKNLQSLIIEQIDPNEKGRLWSQNINLLVFDKEKNKNYDLELKDTFNVIILDKLTKTPVYVFPNSTGIGYGYFKLDSISVKNILGQLPTTNDPILRCSMYISLYENMLNQNIKPNSIIHAFIKMLDYEDDHQNTNLLLGYIESIYWRFLSSENRTFIANDFENNLWNKLKFGNEKKPKSAYLKCFKSIAISENALKNLYSLWNKEISLKGLIISEKDYTDLACELALKNYSNTETILKTQYEQIENKERKSRFQFILPALSDKEEIRDEFFESLKLEQNREKEPWVIDAVSYLNHPLKSKKSVKYISASLEILEELQTTGDIFFPTQWLDATFNGHSSIGAVTEINLFLNEHPDFPENLKNKVLQSSDLVFRAAIIKKE